MTIVGDIGILWRLWDAFAATKLGRVVERRFAGKQNALVIGSTGAGKSQFLLSVDDIAATSIPTEARTEFVVLKESIINGKNFLFRDVPGQRLHSPRRIEAIRQGFQSRKRPLFINVVSYGYHEFGAITSEVLSEGAVRSEFLQNNLERERNLLNELANLLDDEVIVTLVTKADIWWDRREEVLSYYKEGDYAKAVSDLFPRARHIVRPYSSINRRFYNMERSHDFDDDERKRLRTELFRLLCEAGSKDR